MTAANQNKKVAARFQHHRTFNRTTRSPRNEYTWLLVMWPLQVIESTGKIVPFKTGYFHHTPKRGAHRGLRHRYYQNRLVVICTELGIKSIFPFGRGRTAGNNRPHSVNFPFTKLHPSVFIPVSFPTLTTASSSGGCRSHYQQATASSRRQATGSKRNKHQLQQSEVNESDESIHADSTETQVAKIHPSQILFASYSVWKKMYDSIHF